MASRTMLVVIVLVTLVVNLVLDVTTDLPMLARWGVAVPVALVVGAVASRVWTRSEPSRD